MGFIIVICLCVGKFWWNGDEEVEVMVKIVS